MSRTPYLVPARDHRVEESIKRSRFITTVARAESAEAAHAFIDRIRAEFVDATHNCWAFVAGPPGDSAHIGMSDDGEPHGSAGRPMLTTLLHSDVGEVVAVCTRYYGGVKLGTGGLSRAYSGGVSLALEALPTLLRVERTTLRIRVDYPYADAVRRSLSGFDAIVENEAFGEAVVWELAVADSDRDALERTVRDLTNGSARLEGPEQTDPS